MALFVLFNCILPNFDVITDGLTYFDLIERAHYNWAFLNMYFMWNSFVLHAFAFFYNLTKSCCNDNHQFVWSEEVKKVVIHIPFAMPLKNFCNSYLLYRLNFGLKDFEERNRKRVEEIQHEAGMGTMYESFMEGGPQSVHQLIIVLSTGRISRAQMISIPISITARPFWLAYSTVSTTTEAAESVL